jgi:hypothetical protein
MNNQELKHQAERVETYRRLCEVEKEVIVALEAIKSDNEGPFTANFSRVKPVTGFSIHFSSDISVNVAFPHFRGLKGWAVSRAISYILQENLDRILKEKEEL